MARAGRSTSPWCTSSVASRYATSSIARRREGDRPFQSLEGLSLGVDVIVRYAIDPARLGEMAASLPPDLNRDLIEPVVDAVLHRTLARHTTREIFSTKRTEIEAEIVAELKPLLARDGVVVRGAFLGNVDLPQQYRSGLESLLAEELASEKMRWMLEIKEKAVKQTEFEAAADKVRRETAAQAAGQEEIIAAQARAEAMKHVLPLKEKEIDQRRLEAEASRVQRVKLAEGEAEARRIEAGGEADARRKLADSDAYRLEVTGKASSEQLARESVLIKNNPLLIQKTLADKLSDKVQVIIAPPQVGGFFASGLLGQPPPTLKATATRVPAAPLTSWSSTCPSTTAPPGKPSSRSARGDTATAMLDHPKGDGFVSLRTRAADSGRQRRRPDHDPRLPVPRWERRARSGRR